MFTWRKKTYQHYSDLELIDLFRKSSDQLAFGELYIRYSHLVLGTCNRYLKDEDEALDVTSSIFEALRDQLKKHSIQHFKSWLYQVVRNACLQFFRSQKKMTPIYKEYEILADPSEIDSIELKEKKLITLEEAIETLSEDQKKCIQLFYLDDKSYTEISDELGIDIKQVKSAIQNGKRNLKIKLEKEGIHHSTTEQS